MASRLAASQALFERARLVLPGGVARSVAYHPPHPVYLAGGDGAHVRDVDGNRYLDVNNNYTTLVLGHRHPAVLAAVEDALAIGGASFGCATPFEVELAEAIARRLDDPVQVRFSVSGTEAAMFATRLARAITGRARIVKIVGGYHGLADAMVAHADERPAAARGIPDAIAGLTVEVPIDRLDDLAGAVGEVGDVAAVIVEPMLGSTGMIPLSHEQLHAVAAFAAASGALLIADEVITFRLAPGGLARAAGLRPDITLLGKLIGGGFALSAIVGTPDVMVHLDPAADAAVYHSGTFAGNPVAAAAGAATLGVYDAAAVARLNATGERFRAALTEALPAERFRVTGRGSLFQIHCGPEPVDAPPGADRRAAFLPLFQALLTRGVLLTPRGMGALSLPMTDADLDRLLDAIVAAAGDGRA